MRLALFPGRRKAPAANGRAVAGHLPAPKSSEGPLVTRPLNASERELVEWFVDFTALMSLPASVGQIYGLLYLSGRPLPFDNFVERLGISKGSASQGLKFLRTLGAVRVVSIAGDRREFYEAEISPTRLVAGFLKEKVQPRLKASDDRLARLKKNLQEMESVDPLLTERVHRLHVWNQRARQFLPVVSGLVKIRT
ncbi:MAG TPA: transcriptional regulator [Opitutales bacterium]|jgi:DNA-binding transcriptional regulator GbsR (MarR family)|nr:transcriptional regulator [Opitutales bacterium]